MFKKPKQKGEKSEQLTNKNDKDNVNSDTNDKNAVADADYNDDDDVKKV